MLVVALVVTLLFPLLTVSEVGEVKSTTSAEALPTADAAIGVGRRATATENDAVVDDDEIVREAEDDDDDDVGASSLDSAVRSIGSELTARRRFTRRCGL